MDYIKLFKENNLDTIEKFFTLMQSNFLYGWMDQSFHFHSEVNDAFTYSLQTPFELFTSKVGNCWDMVEIYRCFFQNMTNLRFETYYLFYDDGRGCPSHSILVYYNHDKVYWFEPMLNDEIFYFSGIHEYDDLRSLFYDFKAKFIQYALINHLIISNYDCDKFYLYRYEQPSYHINGCEMRNHIDHSVLIDWDTCS